MGHAKSGLTKLVHGVVFTARFERGVAMEELFVVVADIGACHVLVFDRGDTLANLLALNACDVGQHAFVTEVTLGEVVGRQRCRMVGG